MQKETSILTQILLTQIHRALVTNSVKFDVKIGRLLSGTYVLASFSPSSNTTLLKCISINVAQ